MSKAEDRLVAVDPDDPLSHKPLVEQESVRILRRRGDLIISETSHGFVCANAGIDLSNVERGYAALLPVDSDRSARRIRDGLRARAGVDVARDRERHVRTDRGGAVSPTWPSAAAGIAAVVDLRGTTDALGREMQVTEVAVVDEIAAAAELVMGKASGIPVAVVRGLDPTWFRDRQRPRRDHPPPQRGPLPMNREIEDLSAQHAELRGLIGGCGESDWLRPTPCEGWDVGDVLLHLTQSDELAIASARGDLDTFRDGFLGSRDRVLGHRGRGRGGAGRVRACDRRPGHRRPLGTDVDGPSRRAPSGRSPPSRHLGVRAALRAHAGDDASGRGLDPQRATSPRHWTSSSPRRTGSAPSRVSPGARFPTRSSSAGRTLSGPVELHLVGPAGVQWDFVPDDPAVTTIHGSAIEFCEVAARRVPPDQTGLSGVGPDVAAVLELVRTYAL